MHRLVLIAAGLFGGCAHDPDRLQATALAQALASHPEAYAVVDVRSEAEWKASSGHIAGAQHLPWPGIKEVADQIAVGPGQEIVLICFTGHRSQWAMEAVRAAHPGVPVRDLKGGMLAWWGKRLGVVKEERP